MSHLALLLLWACGSPPVIQSVDPTEALGGSTLKILGADFPEGATVALVQGETVVGIGDAKVLGPVLIEGTLPDGIAGGVWTVRVSHGDLNIDLADALTVVVPEVEAPCSGEFTANTQLSLARELVVVDRFYKDERRETLRIPIPEIEQVEYELVKLDDDQLCSVIYMKKKDGQRVVFDDDTRLNLKPRAYKLANVMKKPAATTREDVEKDERPVEEN